MNSCGGLRGERAVERDHDELLDAERGDQVGLAARASSAAWAPTRGATTVRGCGSKVSTVSAPRMTSRWPSVHAVELAHRERGAGGARVGEPGDVCITPRKPTTGLSSAAAARLGEGDQAVGVAQPDRAPVGAVAGDGDAVGGRARASSPVELDRGQERAARRRAPTSRSGSASATSNGADARAPQLHAVGVAEVGDQRAHVGARRAVDRERRAASPSRQQLLEARRRVDLALGQLDVLAARGPARRRARRRP